MDRSCNVSLILCTYNRCRELRAAIHYLLAQADGPPFELLVVDNNSTDATRSVVESWIPRSSGRLRYVFEPQQGLSYARNAGLACARGDIVAFTDDDVRVSRGWVGSIARTFAERENIECLGGRTLPAWPAPPPRWLTKRHWVGPLALQDYGDYPFVIDARRPLSLAGANLALRKAVFGRIGLFSPDYPRSEDTEFLIRFWVSGGQALYVPTMLAHAAVQPERLTKTYHRRWHSNIGRCNARMLFEERSDPVLGLRPEVPVMRRLLGVPRFAFRQLGLEACRWIGSTLSGSRDEAFWHEVRVRSLAAYIDESRLLHRPNMSAVREATQDEASAARKPGPAPALTRIRP